MDKPDVAMAAAIEEKMRPLRARYFETLRQRMRDVERVMGLLLTNELLLDEHRATLLKNAHQLEGTGKTYGFPQISKAGGTLEDAMRAGLSNDDPALLGMVIDIMNVCHEVLAQHEVAPTSAPPAVALPATTVAPSPALNALPLPDALEPLLAKAPILLVLDDDQSILDLLSTMFQDDAQVITGTSAAQALELIRKHQPDLILLDNLMPGGATGLSLLERLQNMPEFVGVPVIMISGSGKPEEVMRGLMAGAVDYITKPFDAHDMAVKVRKRLWRSQSVILVADDDESVRDLLVHKLRADGCHVVSAADGSQAWEMLQAQTIALAVLDLMMPGYDGMTLLRMMKEQERLSEIPVVLLTARHMSSYVLEGLNTGAADYITKPFNSNEVVTRCIRLLRPPGKRRGA